MTGRGAAPAAAAGSSAARGNTLTVVIPALNEAASIAAVVADAALHADEVLVVDGGSTDATAGLAAAAGARVIASQRGRALQMNAGAGAAAGDVLLFLHADTRLPPDAGAAIRSAIAAGARWGRFDAALDSRRMSLAGVAFGMNLRSRVTGICTGDQAIFVSRRTWRDVGGYAPIPLMEDIDLTSRLRRLGRPASLRQRVVTSARRWERHGVLRTVVTMWWLRALYWFGVSPIRLHAIYYGERG